MGGKWKGEEEDGEGKGGASPPPQVFWPITAPD